MKKIKLSILFGITICASIVIITSVSSSLYTFESASQKIITQQASLRSEIKEKKDYPMIKNSDFIASLIVNGVINREKLSAYFELINIPETATFELDKAKTYEDGLFEFTLSVSPWKDETGTEVTNAPWKPQLTIELLSPNYVPPKNDYLWLWILIGVVGAIAIAFIIALIIQHKKDLKQFPYKLKLG